MPRLSRPAFFAMIGAVVAGVAIAFGLMLADIEDPDVERPLNARGGSGATTATPTPAATNTPMPTLVPTRPAATATPANARAQSPLDRLNGLGRDLQDAGRDVANAVTNAATFGTITSVTKDEITIKTITGGSYSTKITNKTETLTGAKKMKAGDLRKGDSVFIISMDGGKTAFSINSFGALATVP